MKALTKSQTSERLEHAAKIREAQSELETAVEKYNGQLLEMREDVEAEIAALNEAIADANTWLTEVAGEMNDHYESRSEKWQEGENGQAYSDWKDLFDTSGDTVDVDFPDPIDLPECDLADILESLPDEP